MVSLKSIRLLLVIFQLSQSDGACRFPNILWDTTWFHRFIPPSLDDDYLGKFGMKITFSSDRMTAANTMNPDLRSGWWPFNETEFNPYDRTCEELVMGRESSYVDGQTYFVSESLNRSNSGFRCLRIYNRTSNILQIGVSGLISQRPSQLSEACSESNLQVDPWVLMRKLTPFSDPLKQGDFDCPASGGYTFVLGNETVYDRKSIFRDERCHNLALELQCLPGEYVTMDFKDNICRPFGLRFTFGSEKNLFTLCIGVWEEGGYVFRFMLGNDAESDFYTLRFPKNPGMEFDAHLIYGALVDMSPDVEEAARISERMVIRMSLSRDIKKDNCADDLADCSSAVCSSGLFGVYGNECLKSCKHCNSSFNRITPGGNFDQLFQGTWKDAQGLKVIINESSLLLPEVGTFKNIGFEKVTDLDGLVIMTTFDNGCRPRYKCIDLARSGNILKWRMGQSFEPYPGYGPSFPSHFSVCSLHRGRWGKWLDLTAVSVRVVSHGSLLSSSRFFYTLYLTVVLCYLHFSR
ncbi:uncharacterized protein LOC106166181 [Lingula anatina]|uniref:Uncharacterized protein LOC106166181 n=1 Tax=Lingula anatina TaxID=7574 RepID=A0A1S3IQB8_LINAN|nr:uncharacterized protein LOC106166181 [Lingula anatina]|eukprot:XP_013400106.1 uncharacterized protein LOC106166181 [Lingula anatina]